MLTTAQSRWCPAPLMSAVDVRRHCLGRLGTAVDGAVDSGFQGSERDHVQGCSASPTFMKRELIGVVLFEAVGYCNECSNSSSESGSSFRSFRTPSPLRPSLALGPLRPEATRAGVPSWTRCPLPALIMSLRVRHCSSALSQLTGVGYAKR